MKNGKSKIDAIFKILTRPNGSLSTTGITRHVATFLLETRTSLTASLTGFFPYIRALTNELPLFLSCLTLSSAATAVRPNAEVQTLQRAFRYVQELGTGFTKLLLCETHLWLAVHHRQFIRHCNWPPLNLTSHSCAHKFLFAKVGLV